ncbi:heme peroxidase [Dunaliella salina]|uniref:Heme peroxidase n=1 Tax=Dunaliella salina TaxID=3046 RepID=A0ABQ7GNQ1_DUNSA|nr:heme peroxidase [Dunaliella salina]|eukprot:KAF5836227.1 heme peroxidase [Dunaliella salina]
MSKRSSIQLCISIFSHAARPEQPTLPHPNFIVPGSDPTGLWGRIEDRLWNDVFTRDTHFVCPNGFRGSNCGCTPERFAGDNVDPDNFCVAYDNVRCGFLGRKAWRAVFHDFGTYNKNDDTGGLNGSLRYELNSEKNLGNELRQIINIYEEILAEEVDALGTMDNGDPRGMADLIVLGGVLALYGCGHPGLMFSPGREDASVPDADILPAADESPEVMFGKFDRMGFSRAEVVTLMAAGHTVANGLEGAAFDSTPAQFDMGWFGQTLAGVAGVDNFPQFQQAPFIVNTDAHLVNNDETRAIMVHRATASNGKATFLEDFENVSLTDHEETRPLHA